MFVCWPQERRSWCDLIWLKWKRTSLKPQQKTFHLIPPQSWSLKQARCATFRREGRGRFFLQRKSASKLSSAAGKNNPTICLLVNMTPYRGGDSLRTSYGWTVHHSSWFLLCVVCFCFFVWFWHRRAVSIFFLCCKELSFELSSGKCTLNVPVFPPNQFTISNLSVCKQHNTQWCSSFCFTTSSLLICTG